MSNLDAMVAAENVVPKEVADHVSRQGMAAFCLWGQPFGFTRQLVAELRHSPTIAPHSGPEDAPDTFVISREDLALLLGARTEAADKIDALLPPEEE